MRSLTDYGAFIDIGGVDGLLHISDIAWSRVEKPADILTVGQQIDAKVLKIEPSGKRISLGLKQLQPHPWDAVARQIHGRRARPRQSHARYRLRRLRRTRARRRRHGPPLRDVVGQKSPQARRHGEARRRRRSHDSRRESQRSVASHSDSSRPSATPGPTQPKSSPPAREVEGPVTSFTKFGAFVQLAEGIEGMIHVSEISAEKRIERPQDVLRVGQVVKAKVLDVDKEKRQIKLSMKQLVPTGLDEYIAEQKIGRVVSGRLIEISGEQGTVELGDGIHATARLVLESAPQETPQANTVDLSSLGSMLAARWKNGPSAAESKAETVRAGQVRSFRITMVDRGAKKIRLQLV